MEVSRRFTSIEGSQGVHFPHAMSALLDIHHQTVTFRQFSLFSLFSSKTTGGDPQHRRHPDGPVMEGRSSCCWQAVASQWSALLAN